MEQLLWVVSMAEWLECWIHLVMALCHTLGCGFKSCLGLEHKIHFLSCKSYQYVSASAFQIKKTENIKHIWALCLNNICICYFLKCNHFLILEPKRKSFSKRRKYIGIQTYTDDHFWFDPVISNSLKLVIIFSTRINYSNLSFCSNRKHCAYMGVMTEQYMYILLSKM